MIALISGVVIFLRPERGRFHRSMGYVFSSSMIILIVTAFSIYRLTRSFNILHGAAIVSSVTLSFGLLICWTGGALIERNKKAITGYSRASLDGSET